MDNKYTGHVGIELGDIKTHLVYDWEAIAYIKTKYGQDVIQKLYSAEDADILADVLAAGLKRTSPELTCEDIKRMSPPIFTVIQSIDKALAYAYFGKELDKVDPEQEQDKKKFKMMSFLKRKTK